MTTKATTADTEAAENTAARHKVGDLIRVATAPDKHGYALVAGFTDDGHPLVLDLHGLEPREHQAETEAL